MNGDHIDMGDGKRRAYSHLMILIAHWLLNVFIIILAINGYFFLKLSPMQKFNLLASCSFKLNMTVCNYLIKPQL